MSGAGGPRLAGLATTVEMSKSGLVGRFGSKQQLQLAVLEQAADMFRRAVYDPAATQTTGMRRLNAICDAWIDYLGHPPFPGGCFLTTASVEFDPRSGPVNGAVRRIMRQWLRVLEREARSAIEAGELPADSDATDVAFTLNALAVGANCEYQLHQDPHTLERAPPRCRGRRGGAGDTQPARPLCALMRQARSARGRARDARGILRAR
jgi:AcrR family transcriptional regulator